MGHRRVADKPVDKLLALNLLNNVLVVVVSKCSREFVIVHVVLVFSKAPQFGNLFGVDELELAFGVGPSDNGVVLLLVVQQF